MKFKIITLLGVFLSTLFLTSCEKNNPSLKDSSGIANKNTTKVNKQYQDEDILNSKEFKAIVENRKKMHETLSMSSEEQQKLLYEDLGLNNKQRRDLLGRSIEQSQKVKEYLDAKPSEKKNRKEIEKKFFDEDVLEYKTKSRSINKKYTTIPQEKRRVLYKEFKSKFPALPADTFNRLMKSEREKERRELDNLALNGQKFDDDEILNSPEFKAIIEQYEKTQAVLARVEQEHLGELRNAGLNEEQIKDLSKRNREQTKKRMEEHFKNKSPQFIRDRETSDKKFYDQDVIAYKNRMMELLEKYNTEPVFRKQSQLYKQFRKKFTTVSREDYARLLKLAKETKNN